MTQESSSTKVAANGGGAGDTGVDAVREVLLGDRLRMYEQRFELLDKTVQSEREAPRESFEQRLGQLEVSTRLIESINQLEVSVEAERQTRTGDLKGLAARLDQSAAQFRK